MSWIEDFFTHEKEKATKQFFFANKETLSFLKYETNAQIFLPK